MNSEKILIEIAAYCDPELLNTVNSALLQADYPERIYFSICYQSDDIEDYEKLRKIKNCKVKWLKEKESRGLCYARYVCQQMIDDEDYIYQIDSHMRFVKHWDTCLIKELLSLNDEKAIISFYPPDCTESMMSLPLDDKIFDNPTSGGLMYVTEFRDRNTPFVKIECETIGKNDSRAHIRSAFISGGNLFSFSAAHKEVLPDREMYFYGDELFMCINFFTHGWNVYNSGVSYIYHQYNRKNQKFSKVNNAMEIEKNRLLELLNHRNDKRCLEKYNMGNIRTIEEYEKFSGIDFNNRIIYLNASTGEAQNEKYIGKILYLSKKNTEQERIFNAKDKIEVLIVDLFNDYKNCIKSCLANATNKENISFIVGSTTIDKPSEEEKLGLHIKEYISFFNSSHYSEILNKISKYVGNNYVTIIDSSVRFLNGWDKYLCDNLKLCGNNAALTSWLWETDDDTIKNMYPYINIEKKIQNFYSYLPILYYDDNINLSNINYPYQTSIIYNGFIFFHSSILKKIEFDPNLNYEEQKYLYSMRLWTNGINLYLPQSSYLVRNREEKLLNANISNLDVVCSLSGIKSYYSRAFESDYPYDLGSYRPLWTWYKHIGVNYNIDTKEIA